MNKRLLLLPSSENGRGGGHLFRCTALAGALNAAGIETTLFTENMCICTDNISHIKEKTWNLVVLDRFRTTRDEMQAYLALGPVVGIDEGLSRNDCDFLLDLLPLPAGEKPNLCAPYLLHLPEKRRPIFSAGSNPQNILVSFGAEDAAGLTVPAALAVQKMTGGSISISVVLGPLQNNNQSKTAREILQQAGITLIQGNSGFELKETLADYDLLITHFGITAFEALHARVPVLLVNPGPYHEKLSRYAGFVTLNIKHIISHSGTAAQRYKESKRNFSFLIPLCLRASVRTKKERFIKIYSNCIEKSEETARRWGLEGQAEAKPAQKPQTLAKLLADADPHIYRSCPLCGAALYMKTIRFPGRTYRLCCCSSIYMNRLTPPEIGYNYDYFFTEYQKQYGKTYLEDFPKLQENAERRLNIIRKINNHREGGEKSFNRLLDIGCAYGPFLAAAKNKGFEVLGIDPAGEAVEYVQKKLGIDAIHGEFPHSLPEFQTIQKKNIQSQPVQFDIITLWYVLEHFKEPGRVLLAINCLLKMGGILAFSTPSAAGISRRKSLLHFLDKSPADHWTVWDPRHCAAILLRYGFTLKKRLITGHHPERFPGPIGAGAAAIISRLCGLGDTFEAYAVKTAEFRYEDSRYE